MKAPLPALGAAVRQYSSRVFDTAHMLTSPECQRALVVLNTENGIEPKPLFHRVWESSELKICADGGANRLFDSLSSESRDQMLPDAIKGDLDSIRPEAYATVVPQACES